MQKFQLTNCATRFPTVDATTRRQGSRRKGNRGQEIEEESDLSDEYASALDMSCLSDGLLRAPQLPNGEVVRYTRYVVPALCLMIDCFSHTLVAAAFLNILITLISFLQIVFLSTQKA